MRLVCIALASLLAVGPAAPEFSNPDARAEFERAGELYKSDDFEGASNALRRAYELEPIPTLLYSRAQVERRLEHWASAADLYRTYLTYDVPEEKKVHARRHGLFSGAQAAREDGDCERAVSLYDEFLESHGETPEADDARAGRQACTETLAQAEPEEPEPEPKPEPVVVAPPPAQDRPTESSDVVPWYRSVAGGVLAGVGVAGVATGATLVGLAYRDRRLAQDEPTHDGSVIRYERARQREIAGVITLSVAGASLVFAGLAYGLSARRANRRARST